MDTLVPLYKLFLKSQLSRGRLVGLGLLGGLSVILAFVTGSVRNALEASVDMLAEFGLGLTVPVCAAWIGTSIFGDIVEDRLLVYLWQKPVERWQYAVTAVAAALTILVPLALFPLLVAALVANVGTDLVVGVFVGGLVNVVAYAAVFVALGLRFRRGLWWGLAYILVWENAIARFSDFTSELSIRSYGLSVLAGATDENIGGADRSSVSRALMPCLVLAASIAYITWRFDRSEID